MSDYQILPYKSQCLAVFEQNVPTFFAVNEREDLEEFFTEFLGKVNVQADGQFDVQVDAQYMVVLHDEVVNGCFGLTELTPKNSAGISWIMISPTYQGKGVSKEMMQACFIAAKDHNLIHINIAASHLSAPFFKHYSAQATNYIENGWGQDMHRIGMVLLISNC